MGEPVSTAITARTTSGVLHACTVEQFVTGFSVASDSAAAAFRLREKTITGKILVSVRLVAGQCIGEGRMRLKCEGDLYMEVMTPGNLEGSIWIA